MSQFPPTDPPPPPLNHPEPNQYYGEADHKLVWSILVSLFCCQPLGIVAIVFSAMAMGANNSGDYAAAHRHAKMASTFINWAVGLWCAAIVVYLLCICAGLIAGNA
ncbi:MAG: CD225/dispanin family protein [Phycisphaeraceae bacterium]